MKYPLLTTFMCVKKQVLMGQSCKGENKKAGLSGHTEILSTRVCKTRSSHLYNKIYNVKLIKSGGPRMSQYGKQKGLRAHQPAMGLHPKSYGLDSEKAYIR